MIPFITTCFIINYLPTQNEYLYSITNPGLDNYEGKTMELDLNYCSCQTGKARNHLRIDWDPCRLEELFRSYYHKYCFLFEVFIMGGNKYYLSCVGIYCYYFKSQIKLFIIAQVPRNSYNCWRLVQVCFNRFTSNFRWV